MSRVLSYFVFVTCFGLMLAGCTSTDIKLLEYESNSDKPADAQDTIWVGREYTGGQQCSDTPAERPNVDLLLTTNSVEILDSWRDELGLCEGCSCPEYGFAHYVLISEEDMPAVMDLGYTECRRC